MDEAKLPKMEEQDSSMKEMEMEENICDSNLTSFLQKDTSFLTPWSWDLYPSENQASTSRKQYLQFPPGSYFSYCMFRCMKGRKKPRDSDYLRTASEFEKKIMEIKARIKKKRSLLK